MNPLDMMCAVAAATYQRPAGGEIPVLVRVWRDSIDAHVRLARDLLLYGGQVQVHRLGAYTVRTITPPDRAQVVRCVPLRNLHDMDPYLDIEAIMKALEPARWVEVQVHIRNTSPKYTAGNIDYLLG